MALRVAKKLTYYGGFTLLELMLAGALGIVISGVMVQALLGDGQNSQRFVRLHAEKANQRRTLELVRSDVESALAVSANPGSEVSACGWGARRPVLFLLLPDGRSISYSLGSPPSSIWRGQVLMRCGPAFDQFGQFSGSTNAQNRVVIDGLARPEKPWSGCDSILPSAVEVNSSFQSGLAVCLDTTTQQLALRMFQSVPIGNGRMQNISSTVMAMAG